MPLLLLVYVEYFQEANLAYSSKKEQAELLQKVRHISSPLIALYPKPFTNKRPGYEATALTVGMVTVPFPCVQVLAASDADADEEGVAPMTSKPQVRHPPYPNFSLRFLFFPILPFTSIRSRLDSLIPSFCHILGRSRGMRLDLCTCTSAHPLHRSVSSSLSSFPLSLPIVLKPC